MGFSRQKKGRSLQKPGEGGPTRGQVQGHTPESRGAWGPLRCEARRGEAGLLALEFQRTGVDPRGSREQDACKCGVAEGRGAVRDRPPERIHDETR